MNSPGTIDSDYRGEVMVPLINHGREPFTVDRGMRIAQMLVLPVPAVRLVEVDELDDDHPRHRRVRAYGAVKGRPSLDVRFTPSPVVAAIETAERPMIDGNGPLR